MVKFKLASQGARYTHAYAPCRVCSPARSAYITGMYPTSMGTQNHCGHRRDGCQFKPPVKSTTKYFREAGYFARTVSLATSTNAHPTEAASTPIIIGC